MFCCSPGGLLVAFVVYWWSLWSLLRGPPTSILVRWPARGPRCVRGCGAGVREVLADLRWHTTITESTKSSALRNSPCNADGFVMFHPAAKPRQWAYFAINYAFCQKAAASWGPETLASPTTPEGSRPRVILGEPGGWGEAAVEAAPRGGFVPMADQDAELERQAQGMAEKALAALPEGVRAAKIAKVKEGILKRLREQANAAGAAAPAAPAPGAPAPSSGAKELLSEDFDTAKPFGKVLELLAGMKTELAKEADADKDTHAKMTSWCQDTKDEKNRTRIISESDTTIQLQTTAVKENTALGQRLDFDIRTLTKEIAANKATLATAEALRKDQHDSFTKDETSLKENIEAVSAAVAAFSVSGSSLLQSESAMARLRLVVHSNYDKIRAKTSRAERMLLDDFLKDPSQFTKGSNFLQKKEGAEAEGPVDTVVGLLQAMVGDFQRDLQDQGRRKTPAKTFGIAAFWLGIGGAPMAPMGLS
eukprot:s294_g15.t1